MICQYNLDKIDRVKKFYVLHRLLLLANLLNHMLISFTANDKNIVGAASAAPTVHHK
jgi:hypothetical protein